MLLFPLSLRSGVKGGLTTPSFSMEQAQPCFPGGASGEEPARQCRRRKRCGFNPWVGKIPWRRAWQPLQYSCLEHPMDGGAWRTVVPRVTQIRTWLKQLSTQAQHCFPTWDRTLRFWQVLTTTISPLKYLYFYLVPFYSLLIYIPPSVCISSVKFSSVTQSCLTFVTPWTAACQASLSITNSWSSLKFMSIESVLPSSHPILCRPLLLLPPIPPSIRVFSNESTLRVRWPEYWSFSFSISPSNEHPGLISFRMDWVDLLAVQGTLMSLLQHHSSKASILLCSAFFIVQLSHPCMTTGKTTALTRWTFVGKVMSLLFNMLSRSLITFLPRSKCILISWLQSPSAVILEPRKIKSATVSTVSPSICHEVMRPDAMILVFWILSFKPTFSLSSSTFIKRLFSSSSLSAIRVMSSAYLRLLIFLPAMLIPVFPLSSKLCPFNNYIFKKISHNISTVIPIGWTISLLLNVYLSFIFFSVTNETAGSKKK